METKIVKIKGENLINQLKLPAEILKDGGIVAFPTETVYGLGANALDAEAIQKIFDAKGRPSDNPLIVHIANLNELNDLVQEINEKAEKVIDAYWPGPLTLIFKKSNKVPDIVTAGLDTVAVRMPSHKIANKLIDLAGIPVAAPSANLSGKPSPTKVDHVILDLMGRVDCIVDGGDCEVGLESTVLDITGDKPMILRPGGITKEDLELIFDEVLIDESLNEQEAEKPKSPGMKYTHYAPDAEVYIIESNKSFDEKGVNKINELISGEFKQYKIGVMGSDEFIDQYDCEYKISLGSRKNMKKIANNLFKALRDFDKMNVDVILSESFESKDIGHAIMNRLKKSAGFKIFKI